MLSTMLAMMMVHATPVEVEVKQAVEAFAEGGDERDVVELDRVLDPSFRVVFALPGKEASLLSRADYLGMIRAGKIGGSKRQLSFGTVDIQGTIAHVKVTMQRADATFDAVLTLVRTP